MALQNFSWVIPDKLAGCAMPGQARVLEQKALLSDLRDLYKRGVRCLLSLAETPPYFGELCEKAGIKWINFPIPDFGVPTDIHEYEKIIKKSVEHLEVGEPICVHCFAGVGRTGLGLASIVGVYYSLDAPRAIDKVRSSRVAIETKEQTDFVQDFLATVNENEPAHFAYRNESGR